MPGTQTTIMLFLIVEPSQLLYLQNFKSSKKIPLRTYLMATKKSHSHGLGGMVKALASIKQNFTWMLLHVVYKNVFAMSGLEINFAASQKTSILNGSIKFLGIAGKLGKI